MSEHEKVSREYSRAVRGGTDTAVAQTGKGRFADYRQEDLANVPAEYVESSFGCGNPLAFSDVRPGQVVLDLGCGAGLDLLLAAERVGAQGRVIGVDANDDMLAIATKRVAHLGNVELKKGRIEALPVASGSVDWVISNCVINLAADKERVFSEIARVLKPGGKMMVSDIVAEDLPWWIRASGMLRASCAGGSISEARYLQGLLAAGLTGPTVAARHFYEPAQMAAVVSDSSPAWLRNIRCCGRNLLHALLTRLATPVAKKLWSARISASAPLV